MGNLKVYLVRVKLACCTNWLLVWNNEQSLFLLDYRSARFNSGFAVVISLTNAKKYYKELIKIFKRTFIQAKTRTEAENHLKNLFGLAETLNLKLTVPNFEPYWKFDDSFQIEINGTKPTNEQLSKLIEGIASKWSRFPDSLLATKELEGCTIFIENIEFIEIFDVICEFQN